MTNLKASNPEIEVNLEAHILASAHVDAEAKRGTVSAMIRDSIEGKRWDTVGEAYGELLADYGKRSRVKGTKEFTPSTPADTFNTLIQSVSKVMECGKLKPTLIESEDGSERWGLVSVQVKGGSKPRVSLADARAKHVALLIDRSFDDKMSELETFAKAMGIEFNPATVAELPTKQGKPTSKEVDNSVSGVVGPREPLVAVH